METIAKDLLAIIHEISHQMEELTKEKKQIEAALPPRYEKVKADLSALKKETETLRASLLTHLLGIPGRNAERMAKAAHGDLETAMSAMDSMEEVSLPGVTIGYKSHLEVVGSPPDDYLVTAPDMERISEEYQKSKTLPPWLERIQDPYLIVKK